MSTTPYWRWHLGMTLTSWCAECYWIISSNMIHRTDTDTVCRELLNNNVLILYFYWGWHFGVEKNSSTILLVHNTLHWRWYLCVHKGITNIYQYDTLCWCWHFGIYKGINNTIYQYDTLYWCWNFGQPVNTPHHRLHFARLPSLGGLCQ